MQKLQRRTLDIALYILLVIHLYSIIATAITRV